VILQLLEFLDQFGGQKLRPRAHDLPELYERRAKLLDSEPDPLIDR